MGVLRMTDTHAHGWEVLVSFPAIGDRCQDVKEGAPLGVQGVTLRCIVRPLFGAAPAAVICLPVDAFHALRPWPTKVQLNGPGCVCPGCGGRLAPSKLKGRSLP